MYKNNGTQIEPQAPADVIRWLTVCSREKPYKCEDCPYNYGEYSEGCGMLLRDAAMLLKAAYWKEGKMEPKEV